MKLINFLKEVRLEIKKVDWPTRKETIKYTIIVIGVCLGVALFLGGIDLILTTVLNKFVI